MLNPFIDLISNIIFLINWALIIWFVLHLLIHFDVVNRHNQLINRIYAGLTSVIEPMLRPIRRLLGKIIPTTAIDLSPLVLILLLNFANDAMYTWFYDVQPARGTVRIERSIDD